MLDIQLTAKYHQLQHLFTTGDRVLVAYSGGIDSTLVAKIAFDVLREQAIAITANSPSLLPNDLEDAIIQAQAIGINHQVINTTEMADPNYTSNPINRCYFCKSELHNRLKALSQELGYAYVVDGLNADDLHDYRPGIVAAKERGVRSPLAEVGMTKMEVRMLSRHLGLPWWNKPSQPCLSSRFPYGEEITIAKLQRVGQAEQFLRQQLGRDLDLRVRSMGDTAQIEIPPAKISYFLQDVDLLSLTQSFRQFGFQTVTLDLEGFRSGKLNQKLPSSGRQDS